jgi:glutamate-1-semialdehyde 2,1-aminomutase
MSIISEYESKHPGSRQLHEAAVSHFAANGFTHMARIYDPFGPYITHALGSKMWDVDGNEYIDYGTAHGGMILGHSHPAIVTAVQDQMARGVHFSASHQLEIEWAELIKSMVPGAERVEFFACGQEANMMAIRLARVFTGRTKVLRFEENYHGWADELTAATVPGVVNPEVTIIPMNDIPRLEKELATKKYAIVLTEGGGGHMAGQVPWEPGFIRSAGDLARKNGTVWLLDEVVTGFRDAPGGWGQIKGLRPDLISLGKAVSGAMPHGVLVGRADIMNALSPASKQWVPHAGTWNAITIVCAAGIAGCKLLKDGSVQKKVNETGAYLREKSNRALREKGYNWRLYGRSIIHTYFGPIDFEPDDDSNPPSKDITRLMAGAPEKKKLGIYLLQRGIATLAGRMFILSIAHSREDIDRTVDALVDAIGAAMAECEVGELPAAAKKST